MVMIVELGRDKPNHTSKASLLALTMNKIGEEGGDQNGNQDIATLSCRRTTWYSTLVLLLIKATDIDFSISTWFAVATRNLWRMNAPVKHNMSTELYVIICMEILF